MAQGKD